MGRAGDKNNAMASPKSWSIPAARDWIDASVSVGMPGYLVSFAVFMLSNSSMSRKSVAIKHLSQPNSVRNTCVSSHLLEWQGTPFTVL